MCHWFGTAITLLAGSNGRGKARRAYSRFLAEERPPRQSGFMGVHGAVEASYPREVAFCGFRVMRPAMAVVSPAFAVAALAAAVAAGLAGCTSPALAGRSC